jgi:hypothetical protein
MSIFKKGILGLLILLVSCQNKPRVIHPITENKVETSGEANISQAKVHQVVVKDFMHASRYTYLNVIEDDQDFWIAIPYTEVSKGETYYFEGGILMHNFESREHDRVFETLYLVTGVSKTPDLDHPPAGNHPHASEHQVTPITNIEPVSGGTTISELFTDPSSFSEKTVTVKGQCVKVNRNIMGKNWIHLQDGSKDSGNNYLDLTVATLEEVNVGDILVFEGKIATNKDFGAGYRYDLIMEEATLK